MADLRARYMGLELKNPVIVGASNLVTDLDNLKKIEEAGAAAVVYKSLFEEQIQLENLEYFERKSEYNERHSEMVKLFPDQGLSAEYPLQHLYNLNKAKETVSIPVIASLNANNDETWVEYAKKIEETGVDGIELNFYTVPEKFDKDYNDIEKKQVETLKKVRESVKIPLAVKLSPFYSNPLGLLSDLENSGADAFVLFNRFFQPDIDTESETHHYPYNLSNVEDNRLSLRFAGLMFGNTNASICSNSGIFSGNDVIKMILAGSDCVQVVSTLYLNKIQVVTTMIRDIEKWMDSHGYDKIDSFRGKLSTLNVSDNHPYHRAQYMDYMMNTSEILKKYKIIN
jgi:dihydroorotate dehydrogenase (fumarate)